MNPDKENVPETTSEVTDTPQPLLALSLSKARFSMEDKAVLVAHLVSATATGRESDKSFKITVWNEIAAKLNKHKTSGREKTGKNCRDHYNKVVRGQCYP